MEKIKLNFDTTPEEEIISPDKNCGICYGKGKMLYLNPIPTQPNDETFTEKECNCITRQRVNQARKKHSAIYRGC